MTDPTDDDQPLPIEVRRVARSPWTHEVWLDESAELALGDTAFARLSSVLAGAEGIACGVHEDREIVLLSAAGLTDVDVAVVVRQVIDSLLAR